MSKHFSMRSTDSFPRNKRIIGIITGMWLILVILPTVFSYLGEIGDTPSWSQIIQNTSSVQQFCSTKPSSGDTCSGAIPSGCTVFTVSKGDRVFFGGNDDYINPDSYYWVDPGGAQGYGAIWVGTPYSAGSRSSG